METLIAIDPVPTQRDYAEWAYTGSGVEHLWDDPDIFHAQHLTARTLLEKRMEPGREYDIRDRLHIICHELNGLDTATAADAVDRLYRTYRTRYYSHCSAAPGAVEALMRLQPRYRLAVVSNFIITGGIEELLVRANLSRFFTFILTSVGHGWRKPHPAIYEAALTRAGILSENILFVGDDAHNDYTVPRSLGMRVLHYDPAETGNRGARFTSFTELPALLGAP